jgi:Flp pilus assembly protein TadG
MMRRLKQLARGNKGAAVVELALAAPILATMVIGVTDISVAYGKKLELEQAAQRAMEKVMQTTGENTPSDTIKKEAVCQYNGTAPDAKTGICPGTISDSNVTVTYSLKCNGVAKDYTTVDCDKGETEIRYITATVTDKYTPMFNMHFGTNSDGTYHLSVTAGVRVA